MTGSRVARVEIPTYPGEEPHTRPAPQQPEPEAPRSEVYRQRYDLDNVAEKLVQNRGDGYADLYGTRNFRMVMNGALYRGGANNLYQQDPDLQRPNMNPLPTNGLKNLCEEGFSVAFYLYSENYGTAPKEVTCEAREGTPHPGPHTLRYEQITAFSPSGRRKLMEAIHANLTEPEAGPVYVHCWNGWHASGITATIALRQFCGVGAEEAVSYWNTNTDGNNGSDYDSIRRIIRNFTPFSDLNIDQKTQAEYCPNLRDQFHF